MTHTGLPFSFGFVPDVQSRPTPRPTSASLDRPDSGMKYAAQSRLLLFVSMVARPVNLRLGSGVVPVASVTA